MKLNFKLYRRILVLLGLIAPLAIALRIFSYWKELDVTTGFFSGNGAGSFIFNLICFAVFFLCLLLTYHKKGSFVGSSSEPAEQVSAPFEEDGDLLRQEEEIFEEEQQEFPQFFLHGFAKKCAIWFGTFSAFAALLPAFGLISHGVSFFLNRDTPSDTFTTVYAVLTLISGGFFLLYAFRNSNQRSRFAAFLALMPAFWCTLRLITEYRDLTRFLNKSLYIGQFLFVISALIFFLYQAEMLLGEDLLARPNAYVFSGLAVVFFGVVARLPQLIAVMGSRISFDLYTSTALLTDLALTVFVASKLIATTKRN